MPRLTVTRLLFFLFFVSFVCIYYYLPPTANINDGYYDDGGFTKDSLEKFTDSGEFAAGRRIYKKTKDIQKNLKSNKINFMKLDENGYVISAFTDDRNGNMGYKFVRVLMLITGEDDFECSINGSPFEKGSLYEFSENHRLKWQVFILNCKLPAGIEFGQVDTVKINRKTSKSLLEVPITYRVQDEKSMTPDEYNRKMSICVPVLFGDIYNAKRIIEFIELNSLQGIEKIFIYINPDEITDVNIKKTLEYYVENNILEVIEFKLPFAAHEIWYHGQLATITDCLLRNTGVSKYTFFHDIDEFFVPVQKNMTLLETLGELFSDPTIGSRRTALKYIATKNLKTPITLNNIVSTKQFEMRFTKCVIRPEMVFEQGIHHTSRVIQDNYQTATHDGTLLRIYHYKEPKYCCVEEALLSKRYGEPLKKQFDFVVGFLDV